MNFCNRTTFIFKNWRNYVLGILL